METVKYEVKYYNKAYCEYFTVDKMTKDAAIHLARTLLGLVEMEDIRVFKVQEIEIY